MGILAKLKHELMGLEKKRKRKQAEHKPKKRRTPPRKKNGEFKRRAR